MLLLFEVTGSERDGILPRSKKKRFLLLPQLPFSTAQFHSYPYAIYFHMNLLNLIYAISVLIFFALVRSPLRSLWWLQFATLFTPFLYLPLPILLLISLLLHDLLGQLLFLLPLFLFAFDYAAGFLPKAKPQATGRPLRVMTWNTLFLNKDVAAALAVIRQQQPDILALQELGVELAHGLAQTLASDYPFQSLFPKDSPNGYGVFSRYPITHAIPPRIAEGEYWCQTVEIDFAGQPITLISAHPRIPDVRLRSIAGIPLPVGFETEPQDAQFRCLLRQIDQVEGSLLVVGDFNLSDRQLMYQEFAKRLQDAQRKVGWGFGFTFPTDLSILDYYKVPFPALPMIPFLRLDYVFYNDQWAASSVRYGRIAGSDHRYLVAELLLNADGVEHRRQEEFYED